MSIKMLFASAAALAMVAGTPALAAKSQSEQTSASEGGSSEAQSKAERKTCRTIDRTESRMDRTRLCLTREQWKKFDDEQND